MGGGDLNLKKSWHPLLQKNREAVWKEEKKALDERKRIAQLRKEHAEEKAIQDLQRMGGHREERVEWLYAAPATGGEKSNEELEAYLLGKKTVTDLFKEKDEQRLAALKSQTGSSNASGQGVLPAYQALGSTAKDTRDIASKVRADPLLAIRQQELASLEAMKKNKTVMREVQAVNDDREQRRREKQARHEEREDRRRRKAERRARRDGRSASFSPPRDDSRSARPYESSRARSRSLSPRHHRDDSPEPRYRQRSPPRFDAPRRAPPPRLPEPPRQSAAERLAAMTAAAAEHQAQRAERMAESDKRDREETEREEALRAQHAAASRGRGTGVDGPAFLRQEHERYASKNLSEHLRGGGRSYVRDNDG